ncbi:MAG: sulfate adenylyltransferase [Deltaproteobacteria bacterium]|nr:sulfate adenylyltransferase [Deltaproteobacteria bacterium]MBI3295893.1 sulfate adenylyltransferase [Deltaproteobacteria bacterium]
MQIPIDFDCWLDHFNLETGVFSPLTGFLTEAEYEAVINQNRLPSGKPWTLPITLPVPQELVDKAKKTHEAELVFENRTVGRVKIESVFQIQRNRDLLSVFGTTDAQHPGVQKEMSRSVWRLGGRVSVASEPPNELSRLYFSPEASREHFKRMGWNTVVGFQTRNPIHRAHEHLQRIGLEICDGLFVQPLVGWKKTGDFTPIAIAAAYEWMRDTIYPSNRVLLGTLRTAMRYGGPKEAVFHALIRKNFGCTHFIMGRDQAGVGNFYGRYDAQKLAKSISDLGIEILALCGPFYCKRCERIVTEKTCRHAEETEDVSGTLIRKALAAGQRPDANAMRPEISDILIDLGKKDQLFVKEPNHGVRNDSHARAQRSV